MSRYIDAHFAQLIADEELDSSGKGTVCWVLAHTPTADVVEVVRCKDCKYFYQDGNIKVCKHWNCHSTIDDAYCSYAKMKCGEE